MAAGLKPGFILRKEMLQILMPNLMCSKCQEIPNGIKPIRFKCVDNFHPLCDVCKDQRCHCGSKIGKNPCSLTSKILENLPSPCCHYKNGCQTFLDQTELVDHQKNCLYRLVNCPYKLSCNEKVIFLHLEEHIAKGSIHN